ncbi:MAG: MATE family efflux transporter [Verrucomicrobia bacterium]|nr:MATE family efflux transporter [Verrucomicrobiota bacterium]
MRSELRPLLQLAIPVILAELGWMLMGVIDTIMVGRLGAEAIGAVAIGSIIFNTVGLISIGLLLGLDTLISQAFGAGDLEDAGHSLRQGFWLSLFCAPVLLGAMWLMVPLMSLWGLDPAVYQLAKPFTYVLALSVFPISLYTVQRRYLQSLHMVRPVTVALLSANLVNLLLNWILIYGNLGAPRLGVTGSAWATVGARIYLGLFLVVVLIRKDASLFRWDSPDWDRIGLLFRLGLPAAGHIFAAQVAGNTAILAGAGFMAASAVAMFLFPQAILRVYTVDERVVAYAVPLFFWAAAFQLFDGIQVVATGALRGRGDTHAPFLAGLFGYWVIGLPVGGWLCFWGGFGVAGLWMGLSLGLMVVSALLLYRWLRYAS